MADDLLDRVRARAADPAAFNDFGFTLTARTTPTPDEIAAFEDRLGYPVPALLRDVLLAVGTGVGPGYGLLGLGVEDGVFPPSFLARGFLPLVNWGCGLYSVADCATTEAPVYVYDAEGGHVLDDPATSWTVEDAAGAVVAAHAGTPRPPAARPPDPRLVRHRSSLADGLRAWVDGVALWDEIEALRADDGAPGALA